MHSECVVSLVLLSFVLNPPPLNYIIFTYLRPPRSDGIVMGYRPSCDGRGEAGNNLFLLSTTILFGAESLKYSVCRNIELRTWWYTYRTFIVFQHATLCPTQCRRSAVCGILDWWVCRL